MYKIIIEPDPDGDWHASVPTLKDCMACGGTPQEALEAVLECQQAWLEIAEGQGWKIPDVQNEYMQWVEAKADAYEREATTISQKKFDDLYDDACLETMRKENEST